MKNAMQRLNDLIIEKNSRICASLNPTWEIIPESFKEKVKENIKKDILKQFDNISKEEVFKYLENAGLTFEEEIFFEYCREYINAVKDVVPVIKINLDFFEKYGMRELFFELTYYARKNGLFVIGEINSSYIVTDEETYDKDFYMPLHLDAITINPYFDTDSVVPFLKLAKEKGIGVFVLVKTVNDSMSEIQNLLLANGRLVYEEIGNLVLKWTKDIDSENFDENGDKDYSMIGAIIGAKNSEEIYELVEKMSKTFFLVPADGESIVTSDELAINFDEKGLGAIVNYSKEIMNAYKNEFWKHKYSEERWQEAVKAEVIRLTYEINEAINNYYERDIV